MSPRKLGIFLLAIACVGIVSAQPPGTSAGPRGYYLVHSNVDGASVFFDSSLQGTIQQGFLLVPVYQTTPRFSTYTVQKEGYEIYIAAIPRFPGKGETVDLSATLGPIPKAKGSIYVVSDPPAAAIYLNGKFQGTTPVTIENVPSGIYTIEAIAGSYLPFTTQVTVFPGRQAVVNCLMEGIIGPGIVMVNSTPPGAQVAMDGLTRGITPLTITGVAPISHVLEVDLHGYFGWTTSVNVLSGSINTVNTVLKPVENTPTGWIQVDSVPSGAEVYLNGEARGTTPGQGSLTLDWVPVGDHVITLRLSGYEPLNIPVVVKSAEIGKVNGVLSPARNLTTGAISVASNPPGADLFIDNVQRGVTPAVISELLPGDHAIMVRKQGYQDASISIQIPGGRTTEVTIPMAAALPAATRATAIHLTGCIAIIAAIVMFRKKDTF